MFTHWKSTNANHSRTQNRALWESENNWSPVGMKNPPKQQIQYSRTKKKKKKGLNKADWCKLANTIAEVMVMLSDETQNKKKHYHDAWGWRPETTLI